MSSIVHKCDKVINSSDPIRYKQERKPGLNPYEAAMAQGDDGFTDPRPCCPQCDEYLTDVEVLKLSD